jgi:hypothetical protein
MEENQIRSDRLCAQLAEHRGYLPAMICAVIGEMLQAVTQLL